MFIPRRIRIIRRLIASKLYKGITKYPDTIIRNLIRVLPKADREFLLNDSKKDQMVLMFSENFKQGIKGFLKEAEIYRQPWGFKLSDINTPVHLWQGTADRNVSARSAKRISIEIPHCKAHFFKDEGHFSLPGKYFKVILQDLQSSS